MTKLVVLLATVALIASACGGGNGSSGSEEAQDTTSSAVPFDQAFIDAMVPHHRDAIDMAKAARDRGLTQPELQTIADNIISSQQGEIDQMLDWREQWFGSRALGPVVSDALGVPEMELGMMQGSTDDIAGAIDVDATFATMMIAHHKGAIAMAEAAKERSDRPEITELADAIIEAQQAEIDVMEPHATGMSHDGMSNG